MCNVQASPLLHASRWTPHIDIKHSKKRSMSLFHRLKRAYKVNIYFFSWTTDCAVFLARSWQRGHLNTNSRQMLTSLGENVLKLNGIGQGISSRMVLDMKEGKHSFLKNFWQGYPAILLVSVWDALPD